MGTKAQGARVNKERVIENRASIQFGWGDNWENDSEVRTTMNEKLVICGLTNKANLLEVNSSNPKFNTKRAVRRSCNEHLNEFLHKRNPVVGSTLENCIGSKQNTCKHYLNKF